MIMLGFDQTILLKSSIELSQPTLAIAIVMSTIIVIMTMTIVDRKDCKQKATSDVSCILYHSC